MKKFYTLVLFALCAKLSFAQIYDREFKPFKITLSAGYAMPNGSDIKGGPLFAIEPQYSFLGDGLSFGLRFEGAMLKAGSKDNISIDSGFIDASQTDANISAVFTCDYYFTNNKVRPYIGGGPGFYTVAAETGKEEGALLPDYTLTHKFGFMFRGGAEIGHFKTGIEYNFLGAQAGLLNGYFGIKLGIILGGGRFELISSNRSPY